MRGTEEAVTMRFNGERSVPAGIDAVWTSLHDHRVLRSVVPGCSEMLPLGDGAYAAALEARVGRVTDTYRGTFSVADVRPGTDLRVRVNASGRFGRLELDLDVGLAEGPEPRTTTLRYDAQAVVGGVVSRLGRPALTVVGGRFTGCFFRDLERCVLERRTGRRLAQSA